MGLGHCAGLWPDDVGVLPERRVLGLGLCKLFYYFFMLARHAQGCSPRAQGCSPPRSERPPAQTQHALELKTENRDIMVSVALKSSTRIVLRCEKCKRRKSGATVNW